MIKVHMTNYYSETELDRCSGDGWYVLLTAWQKGTKFFVLGMVWELPTNNCESQNNCLDYCILWKVSWAWNRHQETPKQTSNKGVEYL